MPSFLLVLNQPWSGLRSLSNSYAAKATVLVPLIGYMILFNANLSHLFALVTDRSSWPVSFRLYFLYFGFCSMAAASVIYTLRCPAIIKRYAATETYIASVQPHLTLQWITGIERTLQASWAKDMLAVAQRATRPDYQQNVLDLHYTVMDSSRPASRALCTIFYVVGFALLGAPAAQAFWSIALLLFNSIGL